MAKLPSMYLPHFSVHLISIQQSSQCTGAINNTSELLKETELQQILYG